MAIAEDFNDTDFLTMIKDIEMLGEIPSVEQLQAMCEIYPQFSLWLMSGKIFSKAMLEDVLPADSYQ